MLGMTNLTSFGFLCLFNLPATAAATIAISSALVRACTRIASCTKSFRSASFREVHNESFLSLRSIGPQLSISKPQGERM